MTTINLNDILQKLVSEVNVQQSGQIRPVSDYQYWMNAISDELFHEYVAAYQLNQMNSDELSPFTVRVGIFVTPQTGQPFDRINLSGVTDYQYLKGIRVVRKILEEDNVMLPDGNCVKYSDPDFKQMITDIYMKNKFEADIRVIDSDRWSATLGSLTKKPTYQKPKCTQDSQGFLLAPKGVSAVVLEYFKAPRPCVYAYTYGAGDIVVYNAAGSTQLEWTRSVENEFITRLMKKYGVRVRDQQVLQAGDMNKKELV